MCHGTRLSLGHIDPPPIARMCSDSEIYSKVNTMLQSGARRKLVFSCVFAVGVCFLTATSPTLGSNQPRQNRRAVAGETLGEDVLLLMSDFERLPSRNWNDCRVTAARVVRELSMLEGESQRTRALLQKFRRDRFIPVLVEQLDFRRTRRTVTGWHVRTQRERPLYPVTHALTRCDRPVIKPLLAAVARKRRSAHYLQQARIVLAKVTGGKESAEEAVRKYVLANPKSAKRANRLSVKHDLREELRKEEQYRQCLELLENGDRTVPQGDKEKIKAARTLLKLLSENAK